MAGFADAIEPVKDLGGAISFASNYAVEEAGQTFTYGVPVMIKSADGGVQIWDGTTTTNGIAGTSLQPANNLSTTGAGAPQGFSPVLGPGSNIGSYAANPYQPLAVITPPMVPIVDGFQIFAVAGRPNVFIAVIGNGSGTPAAIATNNNQVGQPYGLTLDTGSGFWYVDANKSNAVRIVGLDPRQAPGTIGGHVFFTFLDSIVQVNP